MFNGIFFCLIESERERTGIEEMLIKDYQPKYNGFIEETSDKIVERLLDIKETQG
jgi:excinuclease UvrABC nuclease subunit